jgi:hypothetical protein
MCEHLNLEDGEDVEYVPIPMDRETRARLVQLATLVQGCPVKVAGSLLHDLLRDEEFVDSAGLDEDRPETFHS